MTNDINPPAPTEPERLLCPITAVMFRDPVVVVASGNTYEKSAILHYWQQLPARAPRRDPRTNESLPFSALTVNWDKRREVNEFLEEYPYYTPDGWTDRNIPPPSTDSFGPDRLLQRCLSGWQLRNQPNVLDGNNGIRQASSLETACAVTCACIGSYTSAFGFCWLLPQNGFLWLARSMWKFSGYLLFAPVAIFLGTVSMGPFGGFFTVCLAPVVLVDPIVETLQKNNCQTANACALISAVCGGSIPFFVWYRSLRRQDPPEKSCGKCLLSTLQAFFVGSVCGILHMAGGKFLQAFPQWQFDIAPTPATQQHQNALGGRRMMAEACDLDTPW